MNARFITLDPSAPHNLFYTQSEAINRVCSYVDCFPSATPSTDSEERFAVNYVISLFGKRGSGKTTSLFHIRQKLLDQSKDGKRLITKIFVPDVVHGAEALGPAIIRILQDAIFLHSKKMDESISTEIRKIFEPIQEDLSWFWNSAVPNEVLIRDSVSAKQFAQKVFDYHQRSVALPERLGNCFEKSFELIGIQRLIFLIDDADINIELVERCLDFIRYFLSTPLIITIVGADYETLKRRLFNNRIANLDTLNKLPSGSGMSFFGGSADDFKNKEIEAEREYIDAFLTKVLPPSTRVNIHSINNEDLLSHPILIGNNENRTTATAENYLKKIKFNSLLEGAELALDTFVKQYSGVLEGNLREFINQFNILSEIVGAYENNNRAFFGLPDGEVRIPISPGILNLQCNITDMQEAAILHVLRVFMSNSVHEKWRETWAYYNIVDVLSENRLSILLTRTVTRIRVIGTSIDSLIFSTPGGKEKITLRTKEESAIFHILIDLALNFGASFDEIQEHLGMTAGEAYRYFNLTPGMVQYLNLTQKSISKNYSIVSGAQEKEISGMYIAMRDYNAIKPVHLSCAKDMARHNHTVLSERVHSRIKDLNEEFSKGLTDDKITPQKRRELEARQAYSIFYYTLDVCVDQLRAVHSIVFDGDRFGESTSKLAFTTNTQLNWGIASALQGWSFFNNTFKNAFDPQTDVLDIDRLLMFLFHAAQLPYEIIFAVFSSSPAEKEAQANLAGYCAETVSTLRKLGFLFDDGFLEDSAFRVLVKSKENELQRLKKSLILWPNVDFGRRGQSVIAFLEYLQSNPATLSVNEDIRTAPPSVWKKWITDMLVACEKNAAASPEKTEEPN